MGKLKPFKLPNCSLSSILNSDDDVYIKQEMINNECVWSIYNFSGEQLAYTATKEAALLLVQQNDYHALSVH